MQIRKIQLQQQAETIIKQNRLIAKWEDIEIINDNGETIKGAAPVIISASRATDIPAFYADWFMNRLEKGYTKWRNNFNGKYSYYSFSKTRLIVFWSKNPAPIFKHLNTLDAKNLNYYFQFTLNDYDKEKLEPFVPDIEKRIETFKRLSDQIGRQKVIWRFDPLILTDKIHTDDLLEKIKRIGDQLKDYTEKLVISFADITSYAKVQKNLNNAMIRYHDFSTESMIGIARGLCELNQSWKLEISTCAEKIDLIKYGITHNKCIDDELIVRLFSQDKALMDFIGYIPDLFKNQTYRSNPKLKDKGQRTDCQCIMSKDIGRYETCPHLCKYCYANSNPNIVMENYRKHNSQQDIII